MGDHEGGTSVVTDEATAGQVAFNLQGKQIPGGGRSDGVQTEIDKRDREWEGGKAESTEDVRLMHDL